MTKDLVRAPFRCSFSTTAKHKTSNAELFVLLRYTVVSLVTAFFCNLMLNTSMEAYKALQWIDSDGYIDKVSLGNNIKCFTLLFGILITFIVILRREYLVTLVASTITLVVSLVNHYEILLHGTMLTVSDINNFKTVINVFTDYRLSISQTVIKIVLFYLVLVIGSIVLFIYGRKKERPHFNAVYALFFVLFTFVLFAAFFSPFDKSKRINVGSWERHFLKRGYLAGSIDYTLTHLNMHIVDFSGYNEDAIIYSNITEGTAEQYPDIIFILDETWYDLDRFSPTYSDVDYLANWHELNAQKGYAVVPRMGGGTNDTEYELLTSNSTALLPVTSPFSNMQFENEHSIVDYLESLGYSTMAAHPAPGTNYSRNVVFPQFGFDTCHFEEDFTNMQYYGDRDRPTDSSIFESFVRFYEDMPEDQPRFGYLITLQNHSPWTYNAPELDTVHIGSDTVWEDDLGTANEYLSSIRDTDEFISDLVEYFESSDREVVVVMVGDHAPSFIRDILFNLDVMYEEIIARRATPYFIWTNFQNDNASTDEYREMDLCCLAAETLRIAGLPMSPYYTLLSELSIETICFSNMGVETPGDSSSIYYMDFAGDLRVMSGQDSTSNLVRQYYYMEYNNIGDPQRNEFFFSAPQ